MTEGFPRATLVGGFAGPSRNLMAAARAAYARSGEARYVQFMPDGMHSEWVENGKKFYVTEPNLDPRWENRTLLWSYDELVPFSALDVIERDWGASSRASAVAVRSSSRSPHAEPQAPAVALSASSPRLGKDSSMHPPALRPRRSSNSAWARPASPRKGKARTVADAIAWQPRVAAAASYGKETASNT